MFTELRDHVCVSLLKKRKENTYVLLYFTTFFFTFNIPLFLEVDILKYVLQFDRAMTPNGKHMKYKFLVRKF